MRYYPKPAIISMLITIGGWYVITYFGKIDPIFLPSPQATGTELWTLSQTKLFWQDVIASGFRVSWGFLLSIIVAYPIVLLALLNQRVKSVIFHIVEFFRYLPIPVFIPLTILWFGVGNLGKIVVVFLGTISQMIPMFYDSAMLYENKFEAFHSAMKWQRWKQIKNIIMHGSLPYMLDNARLCFGWAWTYLIIAELLGAENGIGYAIIRAQRYLASDKIFAYIVTIGLIGLFIDRSLTYSRKKLFKWV